MNVASVMLALLITPQQPPPSRPPVRGPSAATIPAVKSVTIVGGKTPGLVAGDARAAAATGGQEVVLRVELTGPAPCVEHCGSVAINGKLGGYLPVLVSTTNAVQVPVQRLLVSTGELTGEVKFVTTPVTASTAVSISVRTEGTAPQQTVLAIQPPVLTGFVVDKTNVVSGDTIHATATFSGPPASASAVKLVVQTTSSRALRIPSLVALESGKTVLSFAIRANGLDQDETAQVVATYLDKNLPASIAVRAASLIGVADQSYRVTLDGIAPPKGAVVQLTSANPARVIVAPTVTVPADARDTHLEAQSIYGNSELYVRISMSYRGVTKHYSYLSRAMVKPDMWITDLTLTDRFGNTIQAPADGQPFRLCVRIPNWREGGADAPNMPAPPSTLRFSYRTPTDLGTSTGRDIDVAIGAFVAGTGTSVRQCVELPGLVPAGHHDVVITVDVNNQVDEDREGNNKKELKITRPSGE